MTPSKPTENHPADEPVRAMLHITGRVQGVFYRASAREAAQGLGLLGWARNEPDGSVRAVVEGPRAHVDRFVRWCHEGPPAARVDDVKAEFGSASGEFDGFRITR